MAVKEQHAAKMESEVIRCAFLSSSFDNQSQVKCVQAASETLRREFEKTTRSVNRPYNAAMILNIFYSVQPAC